MANGKNPISGPGASMMDRDYQAEDDHRTLMRSAEVQNDPARMAGAKKHHKKQMKKMALVQRQMMARGR